MNPGLFNPPGFMSGQQGKTLPQTIFTPPTAPNLSQPQSSQYNQYPQQSNVDGAHNRHPFQYIMSCYDPSSPTCPFRHFFYNRLPPTAQPIATQDIIKPPQASDKLWQQVLNDNPRPGVYVPVMATGFSDLQERAKWQDSCMEAHTAKISELDARIKALLNNYEGSNAAGKAQKLLLAIQTQNTLALRIIRIMRRVEVLRRAGRRLSENEQEMLRLLQFLAKKLSSPPIDATSVRVFAFQLNALQEEAGDDLKEIKLERNMISSILPVLNNQQKMLQEIVESVNVALVDYDIMVHGYHA